MPTASQIKLAVNRLPVDSQKLHDIVHGDANTVVTTDNGPVKSIANLQREFKLDASNAINEVVAIRDTVRPLFGSGPPNAGLGAVGSVYYDVADPLNPFFYGPKSGSGWGSGRSLRGPGGSAGNVVTSLADLKAANVNDATLLFGNRTYNWIGGDYSTQVDDSRYIASNHYPPTTGVWKALDSAEIFHGSGLLNSAIERAVDGANVEYRNVSRSSSGAPKVIDFKRISFRGQTSIDGMATIGTPTVAINSDRRLEVTASYNDSTKRVFMPDVKFTEGSVRVLLKRDDANGTMIRFVNKDFAGRALWVNNGAVEYGTLDGAYGAPDVKSIGTCVAAGASGSMIWVELVTGPMKEGNGWILRTWVEGETYPTSPSAYGNYGSNINTTRSNEGVLAFSSFPGSGAATIEAVQILDGSTGAAEALSSVAPIGRWFPRFEGGAVTLSTIRGGSAFRSRVTGTTGVALVYAGGVDSSPPPVLDCFVNGQRYGNPLEMTAATGVTALSVFPTGLDPSKIYDIEWRVRGISEGSDKWGRGAGVNLVRAYPATATGSIVPLKDGRSRILFIGDSITEGIVARGLPSLPLNQAGDVCWPKLASESLGRAAVLNGFGGTGLLVGNDSNQPPADDGVTYNSVVYPFGHAFNYMYDREVDGETENLEAVVINLGTNDFSRGGISAGDFETAYRRFVQKLLRRYPSVRRVIAMRPFNGAFATSIASAAAAVGDPRVSYLDTSGWNDITFTDGVHPNVAGHAAAAARFVSATRTLFP